MDDILIVTLLKNIVEIDRTYVCMCGDRFVLCTYAEWLYNSA